MSIFLIEVILRHFILSLYHNVKLLSVIHLIFFYLFIAIFSAVHLSIHSSAICLHLWLFNLSVLLFFISIIPSSILSIVCSSFYICLYVLFFIYTYCSILSTNHSFILYLCLSYLPSCLSVCLYLSLCLPVSTFISLVGLYSPLPFLMDESKSIELIGSQMKMPDTCWW